MAIVPIREDYTDTAEENEQYISTPVPINAVQAVVVATKTGGGVSSGFARSERQTGRLAGRLAGRLGATSSVPSLPGSQARLYTFGTARWERGDPVALPVDTTTSRAVTTTAEGNVLVQGPFNQLTAPPAIQQTAIGIMGTNTAEFDTGRLLPSYVFAQGISYLNTTPLEINRITVNLKDCHNVGGAASIRVRLCGDPYGDVVLATAPDVRLRNELYGTYSFTLTHPYVLNRTERYYYVVISGVDFTAPDYAKIETASPNNEFGAYSGSADVMPHYWWGGTLDLDTNKNLVFTLGFYGPSPFPSSAYPTGYAVLGVTGTTLTPGVPTPISDGADVDDFGPCYSGPDAMARIPNTNQVWAWRTYPNVTIARVDLVKVDGLTVQALAMGQVGGAGGYATVATPHRIIPISKTEAISLLTLPDKIALVHLRYDGTPTLTVTTQDIAGYAYAEDATLVPGLAHHGEVMLQQTTADTQKLIRLGITWKDTSFQVDALPITQIATGTYPTNYTPRTKAAHLSMGAGTATVAYGGTVVAVRPFLDNGSDDNWLLFTQYNQSDGTIQAQTWTKGGRNGSPKNYLHLEAPALAWNTTASRLLFTAGESYKASATNNPAVSPRLGYYRLSYEIDDAYRSQRERFER